MRGLRGWLAGLAALLIAGAALADPAMRRVVDGNGVDLYNGQMVLHVPVLSIGGANGMAYKAIFQDGVWSDNIAGAISADGSTYYVTFGGKTDRFTLSGSTYTPTEGNGATLTYDGGSSNYTYTTTNGTIVTFSQIQRRYATGLFGNAGLITSIVRRNGEQIQLAYQSGVSCQPPDCRPLTTVWRISSATNSYGYRLSFTYSDDDPTDVPGYLTVTGVKAVNLAYEACDPGQTPCTTSGGWPTGTYTMSGSSMAITDPMGRVTTFGAAAGGVSSIERPGSSSADVNVGYDGSYRVSSVANHSGSTSYAYNDTGGERIVTATDPLGHVTTYHFDLAQHWLNSIVDARSHTTSFEHADGVHLTKVTRQDGNAVQYTYDAHGNVIETRMIAKPGWGLADIVTSATFPCSSAATCASPDTTTDARGQVTNYSYDPTSGLATTVTKPAPASGSDRPEIRYSYGSWQAKDSSGNPIGPSVTLLNSSSTCSSGNSSNCLGTANETVTSYDYGSSGLSNLLPLSVTTRAGDSSVSSTKASTYDYFGNPATSTDPNGQVSFTYYNADHQLWMAIGPDPDGAGPLKNRAVLVGYNGDGTVSSKYVGTANTDTSAWNELQRIDYRYDADQRLIRQQLVSGGTVYTVSETSYDGDGRVDCTAVRMNPAAFGTAFWTNTYATCDLGPQGSYGLDRITRTEYDATDNITKTWSGYRTSDARAEQYQYTNNDKVEHLFDAKGNQTTYYWDGFDRPRDTCFNTGGCTGSDYEELTYGASGNAVGQVTNRRLRDGNSITYAYDQLGRVTGMTPPSSVSWEDTPITYGYDLLDRQTQAIDTVYNHSNYRSYDALGRLMLEQNPWQHKNFGYDAAGNLTYLGYGDGYWVNYSYYNTGEMWGVYENGLGAGGGILAWYNIDDLGRRTAIGRPSGAHSFYNYGSSPWPTSLAQLASGGAGGITYNYSYNPAGQIVQRTSDNDNYSWTGFVRTSRSYGLNALNQYTSVGGTGQGYDARGNLTYSGSTGYAYTASNRLLWTNASSNGSFYYDAIGRLDIEYGGCNLFDYAGQQMTAELDCNDAHVLRRYVYGAGGEPILWYEGSGTSDRRWLASDERGSVVAVLDGSGNATANSYDEYGVPASGNIGRFQYTGQAWLPSAGMYYYRARIYSPTLGRFLQTDPIGYGDGPNWYNYAGGDPVNNTDPSGLMFYECGLSGPCHDEAGNPVKRDTALNTGDQVGYQGQTITFNGPNSTPQFTSGPNIGTGGVDSSSVAVSSGNASQSSQNGDAALTSKQIDEIVVTAARAHQVGGVNIDFRIAYPQEQLWVMYGANDFSYLGINGKAKGNTGENRGTPPRPGYQAIIHTHPSWAEYGPGPKDLGYPVPLYGIAPDGVWVVRPGATSATGLYGLRP